MKLKIIVLSILLITGCVSNTAKKRTPSMCPKFYTYVCEIYVGTHKQCWCEENNHLKRILQSIQQNSIPDL